MFRRGFQGHVWKSPATKVSCFKRTSSFVQGWQWHPFLSHGGIAGLMLNHIRFDVDNLKMQPTPATGQGINTHV